MGAPQTLQVDTVSGHKLTQAVKIQTDLDTGIGLPEGRCIFKGYKAGRWDGDEWSPGVMQYEQKPSEGKGIEAQVVFPWRFYGMFVITSVVPASGFQSHACQT